MIRVAVESVRMTLRQFEKLRSGQVASARRATEAGGALVLQRVHDNISLTDHSLADLRRLDHPYARRHGAIRIHTGSTAVHRQTGTLSRALRGRVVPGGGYTVEFDQAVAPHAAYVVQGTRYMLPRDVLWNTATAPRTRFEVLAAMASTLVAALSAAATFVTRWRA